MQVDRLIVTRGAQQRDDALGLAERVGADEMRALGEEGNRAQELCDFGCGIAMTEHRQAERRLGDEHVARHEFERRAGRIGRVLVVARRHNAHAAGLDQDLR